MQWVEWRVAAVWAVYDQLRWGALHVAHKLMASAHHWAAADGVTSEPELCSMDETMPSYPVHTQAVERVVQLVTQAASAVVEQGARYGYIFASLKHRREYAGVLIQWRFWFLIMYHTYQRYVGIWLYYTLSWIVCLQHRVYSTLYVLTSRDWSRYDANSLLRINLLGFNIFFSCLSNDLGYRSVMMLSRTSRFVWLWERGWPKHSWFSLFSYCVSPSVRR